MNRNKIILSILAIALLFTFACEDEENGPIVDLTTVETGAYPRLIDQTDKLINLFDVAGSIYTYNIEFVDVDGGTSVAEYIVDLEFDDNNPDNGDNSNGPFEYLKIASSEFKPGNNGFLQAPTISITGPEALAAAGVSAEQVLAGDNFNFKGRVVLTDGRVFSAENSSPAITGAAFQGHFDFTLPANCPSDLTGTYDYTTTDVWCDGSMVTGTVDIVAQGGGVYNFSDWSFGAYGPCYGSTANQPGITFDEVCAEVSFTGFTDSFGDTWTFTSSIDGNDWTIGWENTYGESANSVITFPGPVPFTLSE